MLINTIEQDRGVDTNSVIVEKLMSNVSNIHPSIRRDLNYLMSKRFYIDNQDVGSVELALNSTNIKNNHFTLSINEKRAIDREQNRIFFINRKTNIHLYSQSWNNITVFNIASYILQSILRYMVSIPSYTMSLRRIDPIFIDIDRIVAFLLVVANISRPAECRDNLIALKLMHKTHYNSVVSEFDALFYISKMHRITESIIQDMKSTTIHNIFQYKEIEIRRSIAQKEGSAGFNALCNII